MGNSLLDFQHDLGQKAEPLSLLCFMWKLAVLCSTGADGAEKHVPV